jgi:hypothetical protein
MIEEIKNLIRLSNTTTVINDLIEYNMKIAGYMVYLSQTEADLLKQKLIAYNERKEFEANYVITSDEGVTKAEKYAIVKSKPLRDKEIETEYSWQKAKGFRTQVNEFMETLRQKIAALRKEHDLNKFQQG